ncbi:unnamed protein product [Rodentolepis nana]|uniref:40S ribosomal protein S27 n=1 Tax=Rodentolepis nana TaxID=102285 RepID=A0A158QHY7_RODNA|nr:unnamed protein product [Rodentolepis nana]
MLARDLLHPTLAQEKRKCKLKRLVPAPNSYFMDVKCGDCMKIQVVFSHAQTAVVCPGCDRILCTPTGGKAKLTSAYISRVYLEQLTPFPIELDSPLRWRLSPAAGNSYNEHSGTMIYLNEVIIGSWNPSCVSYLDKRDLGLTSCEEGNGPFLTFTFTPTREHFGQNIRIIFFPDIKASFSGTGQILLNTTIQLIKQPKFLDIKVTLDRAPEYVDLAPRDLNLSPPVFLDGSMAKVECITDGALPPQPITFDIVCNNPPRAAVEQERQAKAQLGFPYEVAFRYFNFRSPPTDEELAERIAIGYAQSIMQESRIARSHDNLTLSATLPINSKAHDCSLYCRLMGKEREYRLTVYCKCSPAFLYHFTLHWDVGSSMTCYADGFPEPSIVLSLRQPMHQFSHRPIIDPREYIATTSPLPPLEQIVDTSDIAAATRIGLRPDEYTIRGPRFTLAYNATPGVELMLICTAGNALPNAVDFLGYNKTIATVRFTVAAISYSSIGIVVGICLVILVCAIIIILLMVYLRRRQKYTSNAIRTRNAAVNAADGANGAKMAGHGK